MKLSQPATAARTTSTEPWRATNSDSMNHYFGAAQPVRFKRILSETNQRC